MTLMYWNCRGYAGNFEEIKILLLENNPDIVCLQETFHGNKIPHPPRRYNILSAEPVIQYPEGTRPPRGVITLIRNTIPYYNIDLNTPFEAVAVRVHSTSSRTICNIYIAPNEDLHLADLINLIQQLPPPFIIVGDFNAHSPLWRSPTTNNHGKTIEDAIMQTDACLLNTGEHTHEHIQTGTSSCIDLCLVSSNLLPNYEWQRYDDTCGSDHYPIMVVDPQPIPQADIPQRFIISKADWTYFNLLMDRNYDHLKNQSIEDMTRAFTALVIEAANESIPKSSGAYRPHPVPWWTEACKAAHQNRKAALRRYKRTKSPFDKIELNRASAFARLLKRRARRRCWTNFVESINSDTPMTKIWKKVGKINGKYKNQNPPTIIKDGTTHQDPLIVSNIMGEHFATISSDASYAPHFLLRKERAESIPLNFNTDIDEAYNDPITMTEIRSHLQQAKNTAAGPDEIHYQMLKHLPDSAMKFVLHLFNTIWQTGTFPTTWREAYILIFGKPGKDPNLETSYRPIALTSSLCKLLEKIINSRLTHDLEKKNYISPNQYGFRKLRSCPDALARLETDIRESFARKQHLVAVFFDIAKAYDTAWHYNILKKIHDLGYRGPMGFFISNFLRSRTFRVKIGNHLSDHYPQEQGVPQGSVMSVTLFALAINDIVADIPADICKSLYVDDLAIYYSSNNLNSMERKLQLAINKIKQWTDKSGFTISAEKTVAVHFHNKRGLQHEVTLTCGGQNIHFKDDTKFLGLRFDTKLTWEPHIKDLKAKCIKSLSLLKCLSGLKWGADKRSLIRIYRATTRSKLDYGSQIYASAKERIITKLNVVHHSALRISTGAFRSSPIPSLLVEANEPSLQKRRLKLGLQHYTRLRALPHSVAYNTIYDESSTHLFANPNTVPPFGIQMKREAMALSLMNITVLPYDNPTEPRWRTPETACKNILNLKKSSYTTNQLKGIFTDHLNEHHQNSYHIYTDGAHTELGSGCGVFATNTQISVKLSTVASSFTAEMYAILEALRYVAAENHQSATIFTDSRSAISLMNNIINNNPILIEIQTRLIQLASAGTRVTFCWVPGHTGVMGNEEADRLAGEAAQSDSEINIAQVPYRDAYPLIKRKIYETWQSEWFNTPETNKLRSIRSTIKPWPSSYQKTRKEEVTLTRLRIGHTNLTHEYLMRGARIPTYCQGCLVPITVKHILEECPEYADQRQRNFGRNANLKSILGEPDGGHFNLGRLIQFLNDLQILDKI